MAVVGQSQSCGAAMQELADKPCDVSLPSSVEMLRMIAESGNGAGRTARPTPLLFGMEESSESFLRAVQRGACGYVLNDASSSEVVAAIRAVASGEAVCPPKLCKRLFEHASRKASPQPVKVQRGPAEAGLT